MKGLRFRMTDAQHAELSRVAAQNGRSLQKEIELRVFGQVVTQVAVASGRTEEEAATIVSTALRQVQPEHRADPKDKASQEHAKKERGASNGMCEHRVPIGAFCKRCEEG